MNGGQRSRMVDRVFAQCREWEVPEMIPIAKDPVDQLLFLRRIAKVH
jgi:hypothetical protein